MADNKSEEKNIYIDVNVDEEPIDLGYQGKSEKSQDTSKDELKKQAGELFKAAGGLAGSLGKFAAKKGGELKDKISDEEFQEKVKSSAKAYADKAGTVISSRAAKAEDAIKESTTSVKEASVKETSVKAKAAQKSQQIERTKSPATDQGGGKGNKKLLAIMLAAIIVAAGVIAVFSGGNDEQPTTEEPVAEESVEETAEDTEDVATPEEETVAEETEEPEEPQTVYYSSNTEDTVRDGNSGVYAYKNRGESYEKYYIIDFDEGYVYSFIDGDGSEDGDKVKIDSGNLNDVLMVTYDFDGDIAQYGLHFKYKNNPEHLIVQDNDGFESDYSPTDLKGALSIRNSKSIKEY